MTQNDRLSVDTYDANGNTLTGSGSTFTYDFENRIKTANGGAVTIVYDGDGNRVAKTAGGVTTRYLVDDLNPTGFAQVVEEIVGGQVKRQYTYGNMLISQNQLINGVWTASYYGFDGHGSVRMLTDKEGVVTDTFDYDAFGNLISRLGSTPNNYLYSGEQFDPDLGIYFQRARYYNQQRGRFLTMDPFAGFVDDPDSLHKYLYVGNDPVNLMDPSGQAEMAEYAQRVRQKVRDTIVYMRKHGRDLLCRTLKTASIILSIPGAIHGLADLMQKAVEFGLAFCPDPFCGRKPVPNVDGMFPGLIGVPKVPLDRVLRRLGNLNLGGRRIVRSVEAFGSRAGSTFRGRPPLSDSDLDLLIDINPFDRFGRSRNFISRVLGEIADDFQKEAGFPLSLHAPENVAAFKKPLECTPFVKLL